MVHERNYGIYLPWICSGEDEMANNGEQGGPPVTHRSASQHHPAEEQPGGIERARAVDRSSTAVSRTT